MNNCAFKVLEKKFILKLGDRVCETPEELFESPSFRMVLKQCITTLQTMDSPLLGVFPAKNITDADFTVLAKTFIALNNVSADHVVHIVPGSASFVKDRALLNDFVEYLYNFWRSFDRYIVCAAVANLDKRPYRTFNNTIEKLTSLVRSIYRDVQENITGQHPRIYRQVSAGAEIATIANKLDNPYLTGAFARLKDIPVIRQILIYPPLVINQPMNKRTGKFEKINVNPLTLADFNADEWICYPAKVGELLVLVYFHEHFYELGFSMCNLFDLADDEMLKRKPDAVYAYGMPNGVLEKLGVFPTVFYDDPETGILTGAAPVANEYGYFGYLKKMVLTLHNVAMMKLGRMPFHGSLIKITLKNNKEATILSIGDTGAGKSETLEAFRELGAKEIKHIAIIADDMGSLQIDTAGDVIGYGTEIGAFLRLDDLPPGHAFGQIDRSIIMNPSQTNARVIIPVTTFETIIKGHKIDYLLYANNYEELDEEHPVIEQIKDCDTAFKIFREGTVMSKGTTTTTGLVHSYFANVFGPTSYKDVHDEIAKKFFEAIFKSGAFVGQMRTRLGIKGWERKGPEEAAKGLLVKINER